MTERMPNFINGVWVAGRASTVYPVHNPANAQILAETPLSGGEDVQAAIEAAQKAFVDWRNTPVLDRVQFLFKLKVLLEENLHDLACTITNECGKTYSESVGEIRRGIENVEVACGMPILMQGYNNEDIARGIDEHVIRQPLGIVAGITPFNFPGMIPMWFLPYAVAAGNCFILKPSERVPMTANRLFRLFEKAGFPAGVLQLVNGGKEAVDALLANRAVRGVSFVGSTAVARYVYSHATENGKRAQCQGGAKNPVVIMPDADMDTTARILADSAFGCAGQRCLAAAEAITVGKAHQPLVERMAEIARKRKVGYGLDQGVEMGPVISPQSKRRIEDILEKSVQEGAKMIVDGRNQKNPEGYADGYFLYPTLLEGVPQHSEMARTEIFGPVLSFTNVETLEDAIKLVNDRAYGNSACIFTGDGAAARRFRYEAKSGNVGINVGIAAPMAFFPFSGWEDSFFGDLHGQGRHGMEFYTQTKVVIERWPKEWSRKF